MYGIIDRNNKACMCYEGVASRNETNYRQLLDKSEDKPKVYISNQLHLLEPIKFNPQICKKLFKFNIGKFCSRHSLALSEGDFVKETVLRCAPVLFYNMQNKDAIIKRNF